MADIFLDLKLVFMHNPKCGSRNLRYIAQQLLKWNPMNYLGGTGEGKLFTSGKEEQVTKQTEKMFSSPVKIKEDFTNEHCHVQGIYNLLERFNLNPHEFKFLYVIRHPLDRIVSAYRFLKKEEYISPDTKFKDFIYHDTKTIQNEPRVYPNLWTSQPPFGINDYTLDNFSRNRDNQNHIDFIVKLENFETEMKEVLKLYGINTDIINFNGWQHSAKDYNIHNECTFTDDDIEFIKEWWKFDIEQGSYDVKKPIEI